MVRLVEANEVLVKARNADDALMSVDTTRSQQVIWQRRTEKEDMLNERQKEMDLKSRVDI